MGRIYQKNNFDKFTIPLIRRSGFWQLISFMISIVILLVISYFKITDIKMISLAIAFAISFMILFMISLYKWIKKIKFHSVKLHSSSVNIEKQVTKALINTMKLNSFFHPKRNSNTMP